MCQSLKVLALLIFVALTKSESGEEQGPLYNNFAPSTINFDDIYTNGLSTATEDETQTTTEEDNNSIIQTQFVEFRQEAKTQSPTFPPPKYILNSTFLKETTTEAASTTSTEDPDFIIKVVPVKKNYQRGLLDLLFPPKRVQSFKNVFDTLRHVLSHTFRR